MTQQGGFGKGMLKKVFGSNGKEGEKKKDRVSLIQMSTLRCFGAFDKSLIA